MYHCVKSELHIKHEFKIKLLQVLVLVLLVLVIVVVIIITIIIIYLSQVLLELQLSCMLSDFIFAA